MKHSPKRQEPHEFLSWKIRRPSGPLPLWKKFRGRVKNSLRQALLVEQGFVCAYCGKSLKDDERSSHIEHFWPRAHYTYRTYDYDNLFMSCGPADDNISPKVCGDAKGDWHDPLNTALIPSDPSCERRFQYGGDGRVRAADESDTLVVTMIEDILNLNAPELTNERENILKSIENDFINREFDESEINDLIAYWRSVDTEGRAKNFGHVVALYLEREFL